MTDDTTSMDFAVDDSSPAANEEDTSTSSTSYSQVRHKKTQGTLTLTSIGLEYPAGNLTMNWTDVSKHLVSPPSYPKCLLKLVLLSSNSPQVTFQMMDRIELERIRKDITQRLQYNRSSKSLTVQDGDGGSSPSTALSKKRPLNGETTSSASKTSTFNDMDPVALAVTRSALLAAHSGLRQQHSYLVQETQTVSEDDFWYTHRHLVEDEYAKIVGCAQAGTSSVLQSQLPLSSGKVTLGVEEMRQIFILYPAVHKAYEEKVPLELSDEQFWRKYLESEYFHRDRGRLGTTSRDHGNSQSSTATTSDRKKTGPSVEEQEARAAAVGTDDMFSRYDQKLKEQQERSQNTMTRQASSSNNRKLAVGQFDLVSTYATERGNLLLEGVKDHHPPNVLDDGKGGRVIDKYNRHWAMVLHPDQAVAGVDLKAVASHSTQEVLPDGVIEADADAAEPGGGVDAEMKRLVNFANASEDQANHAVGLGLDDAPYEPLSLQNVEAYYVGLQKNNKKPRIDGTIIDNKEVEDKEEAEAAKRHAVFARSMEAKSEALLKQLDAPSLNKSCFPPPSLGRELLSALTKKMAQDSRSEAASLEMVHQLPEDFRKKLQSYFRRSSELLRHFFGLRKLLEGSSKTSKSSDRQTKLARIVAGMETFYREMEVMRKELPQTTTGELMRKMCLPIMDQLDWAFQLHREGSGGGGGGGFVAVDEG